MPPLIKIALASLAFIPLAGAEYSISNTAANIPVEIREWFRNNLGGQGSCVFCSIGMAGIDQNYENAATMLWDSRHGEKQRHGAGPSRIARVFRERGIRGWNITGDSTFDWARWCVSTGRGAAIGFGSAHFQYLYGYDPDTQEWLVCDNNSPQRIDRYSEREFRRMHLASGRWIVVLDRCPHPPEPDFRAWWLDN